MPLFLSPEGGAGRLGTDSSVTFGCGPSKEGLSHMGKIGSDAIGGQNGVELE